MNESNQIKSIRDILSMQELCCQLAEEASELSQAALKFRRALTKENYTPVSIDTALDSLKEECADVIVAMSVLGCINAKEVDQIAEMKLTRWYNRLTKEGKNEITL